MQAIRNWLIQPFPGCDFSPRSFKSAAIAGLIVFFIIYFLKPFGFDQVPDKIALSHALLYGLVTFLTSTANVFLLPQLLPAWFDEINWTVGKELCLIVWQIISISMANAILAHFLYGWQLTLQTLTTFLGYTAAVGVFPVCILILIKYTRLLKQYQEAARAIEPGLSDQQVITEDNNSLVILYGDYQNEILEVLANDILYLSAADNYIQVFYLKQDTVSSIFLRSTLKKAKQSLANFPEFFRCHRTFIVNLHNVKHISGNAQGLKLHIQKSTAQVPVSRTLNHELKKLMTRPRTLAV